MTEEEKKAINYFTRLIKNVKTLYTAIYFKAERMRTLLNLIEKQQKEIEKKDICLKACEDNLIKERQLRIKQDKVIELMQQETVNTVDYFYKLVEAENE